jgi:hypothetical protein
MQERHTSLRDRPQQWHSWYQKNSSKERYPARLSMLPPTVLVQLLRELRLSTLTSAPANVPQHNTNIVFQRLVVAQRIEQATPDIFVEKEANHTRIFRAVCGLLGLSSHGCAHAVCRVGERLWHEACDVSQNERGS